MSKKKRHISDRLYDVLLFLMFMLGLAIAVYPTFSDVYGKARDAQLLAKYSDAVESLSEQEIAEELEKAAQYNKELANGDTHVVTEQQYKENITDEEKERYESLLDMSSGGVMGKLDIPKIAVSLPLYHYSSDSVLNKGVGHIHGSSLPVGGEGTHSVLIAHRGLPSSKLFSDLPEVDLGDKFYIHVYGETLAYEVDTIETVYPSDVGELAIDRKADKVTLVTCTPYAVNTYRLLVTGHRVPYEGEDTTGTTLAKIWYSIDPKTVLGIGIMAFVMFVSVVTNRDRKKRKVKLAAVSANNQSVSEKDSNMTDASSNKPRRRTY